MDNATSVKNIGIVDIQAYVPTYYIDQSELEIYENIPKGKYTIGLGQNKMAFASDREDVNSICLTVLDELLTRNNLKSNEGLKKIGRIEIGTETIIDKSKSIKTYLMSLFNGINNDIEGLVNTNACYGGTQALFNTIDYMNSKSYNGKLAIVVMGDIAIYAEKRTRSTGGCGAISMLIGPNAKIILEPIRASYMNNVFDFYKPIPTSQYPVVDSQLSIDTYLKALNYCYKEYINKKTGKDKTINMININNKDLYYSNFTEINSSYNKLYDKNFNLNNFDYFCFHSPFAKMVEKAFTNLVYFEINRTKNFTLDKNKENNLYSLSLEQNKELINKILSNDTHKVKTDEHNALKKILTSKSILKNKLLPSMNISKNIGNSYVCALYFNLLNLILEKKNSLLNKRIFMFSYGSGCASTLFTLKVIDNLDHIINNNCDLFDKLESRIKISPKEFISQMEIKEKLYLKNNYYPETDTSVLRDNTYYLDNVDSYWRRTYKKKIKDKNIIIESNKLYNNSYKKRILAIKNQLILKNK